MNRPVWALAWLLCAAEQCLAQVPVTENDFLGDMPIVLSVSRLPQRLDETPGAVSVIDRDLIRRSGARDLADLMRLVPGFQTSNAFEGDAPQASYHGAFSEYSSRIQVLVDGRSVYSPFLLGSTGPGLQTVALEDIERIEVLRGSNSAAYGARAFLGVINIVTRDPAELRGQRVLLSSGQNGVRDLLLRLGWADERSAYLLGADQRADDGLAGSNGHNRVSRLQFRADLRRGRSDEIQLRLGKLDIDSGVGFQNNPGKPEHDRFFGSGYVQIDWRRNLGENADLAASFSHTEERYRDNFVYPLPAPFLGATIDFGGSASNDTVSIQHTVRQGADLRFVWGGELRRERVRSRPLYNTDAALQNDFTRLFGNAEWRLGPALLLNVGAMAEHSSQSGSNLAPRVMGNWHLAQGQTLRVGVSRALRPPSAFEKYADVRYEVNGVLLQAPNVSRGAVRPETVVASELGYLGDFPTLGLWFDLRVFDERIKGFVRPQSYALPAGSALLSGQSTDYVNAEDFNVHGLEYELKWQPWRGGQLRLAQSRVVIGSADLGTRAAAAPLTTSVMLIQKLGAGVEFCLQHHDGGTRNLLGYGNLAPMQRTDLRLARALPLGPARAEVALTLQNLGPAYLDFDPRFAFRRRVILSLRLDH